MKTVVAIGGNALITPGGPGNIADQFAHSRKIARPLADLVDAGWQIVLTHGNGPQVGSIMRRVELASGEVYPLDLGLAVADTQGGMGYMLAQTLMNELTTRGRGRVVTAMITTVVVDPDDPAFRHPSKPIGRFLDRQTALRHRDSDGWLVTEDAGRGWRRVVASPRPLRIVEMPVARRLIEDGHIILFGGGGGIPVVEDGRGQLSGVEAVIDKDLTSAMIAADIEADALALVTGVEGVYVNYGKPAQRQLSQVALADLRRFIAEGQFAAGSMLPKIEAAIDFLTRHRNASSRAVVCDLGSLPKALAGQAGTAIIR
jgi:carbamate kinase